MSRARIEVVEHVGVDVPSVVAVERLTCGRWGTQLSDLGNDGLHSWPCGQLPGELTVGEHREDDIAPSPGQTHHRRVVPL